VERRDPTHDPHSTILFYLLVHLVLAAMRAELLQLEPLGYRLLVLRAGVIPVLALGALKGDDLARHRFLLLGFPACSQPPLAGESGTPAVCPYANISVTVPAPTVRPPSRIANRNPLSMATGVISSTSRFALSPGITISVPSGICATPVTSVVRK